MSARVAKAAASEVEPAAKTRPERFVAARAPEHAPRTGASTRERIGAVAGAPPAEPHAPVASTRQRLGAAAGASPAEPPTTRDRIARTALAADAGAGRRRGAHREPRDRRPPATRRRAGHAGPVVAPRTSPSRLRGAHAAPPARPARRRPVERHARGPPARGPPDRTMSSAQDRDPPAGPSWTGAPVIVQAKLAISAPGDRFEREADAVAARVLRGAPPAARAARRVQPSPPPTAGLPATVTTALQTGGGRPLPAGLRERLEPHVGADLSGVRVREAADAARDLGARAFTSGGTIFLRADASAADVALMAHEAAHVVQQQPTLMRLEAEDVIPDWILDGVRSAVRAIPGYEIITTIAGEDLLTGEPARTAPHDLVETLLTYGPFGDAVATVLSAIDVLGDVVDVITAGLDEHDLSLARIGRDMEAAWDEFSIANGVAGNVAIVERLIDRLLRDVAGFVSGIADRVIEVVRSVVADIAEPLLETDAIAPIWNLTKKVLRYDPLRGEEVQAETAEIIADFLRLIGEDERLEQMQERGTLQETADWLDTQLTIFHGLIVDLGVLFADAWAAIQPENLPDLLTNLESLAGRAFGLVQRVGEFGATLILKVLELVKDSLLGFLRENARAVPGYDVLTFVLEQDPFTGKFVERTATNLIRGFMSLMPGGAATYDELAESGVIEQAAQRIETAMARLGISVELITGIFRGLWDTLSLDDLLDPFAAFERVIALFGEPLARLLRFVVVVIEVVVTLVLRLMSFPTELLGRVIANVQQAIDDIAADPVGFLLNMLAALKLGFQLFFDHILGHLFDGLVAWLFRGLGQLGIQLPTDFSLGSVLDLVFQVLGLTMEHLWEKLAEHIGPERVAQIRGAIDMLGEAWAFIGEVQRDGLPAVWRFISDQLGNLWQTLLGMATEWIMTRVVAEVTRQLLTLLDPTGIMAVINSCVAFYNAIRSAIEYFRDMLEIVAGYVETLAAVAAGNVEPGAQMLERGLANAIPIAIGFLAAQVGLGNVPEKIVEIIGAIRETIDRAIDWLIEQALRLGRAALDAITGRRDAAAEPETPAEPATPPEPDTRSEDEKQAAVDAAVAEADRVLAHPGVPLAEVRAHLPEIQRRHQLTSIELVSETGGRHHVAVTLNPTGQTPAERLLSEAERAELVALAERFAAPTRRNAGLLAHFRRDRLDFVENSGIGGLRSGDIAERVGRPVLESYAAGKGLTVWYGVHLQIVDASGRNVGGTQAELDGLLLAGVTVAEVLSAKLNYADALDGGDIAAINASLAQIFDPTLPHMSPGRAARFGGVRRAEAAAVRLVHEGGSMSLADFQARYRRAGALRFVGLSGVPDARAVPRAEDVAGAARPTTRLTIGEMAGVTRAQLRRLLTDAIAQALGEPEDPAPFPG